ncbi:MAG: phosphotransferase [Phycisphaerales bacterium]
MPEFEGQSLASALDPQLHQACRGHLGKISWFKADWQHGGAGTGFSTWRVNGSDGKGRDIPCVVKLPIGYTEYFWTKRLGLVHTADWDEPRSLTLPTPRVLAAGFELEGYDLAWIVMERFANPPIALELSKSSLWEMFEAAAEFHAGAILERPIEPERVRPPQDWAALLETGLSALQENKVEDSQRWINALERIGGCLDDLGRRWNEREIDTWCHHDLHPHNAMRRMTDDPKTHGHCALIDLAMVAPGSWIEDALYMERLFWGREDQLCGIDPLATLASTRAAIGLPADEEAMALADVRRVLMAASAPAFLRTEGDPVYLKAALGVLERLLPGFIG